MGLPVASLEYSILRPPLRRETEVYACWLSVERSPRQLLRLSDSYESEEDSEV
jgi:hypothetical protein